MHLVVVSIFKCCHPKRKPHRRNAVEVTSVRALTKTRGQHTQQATGRRLSSRLQFIQRILIHLMQWWKYAVCRWCCHVPFASMLWLGLPLCVRSLLMVCTDCWLLFWGSERTGILPAAVVQPARIFLRKYLEYLQISLMYVHKLKVHVAHAAPLWYLQLNSRHSEVERDPGSSKSPTYVGYRFSKARLIRDDWRDF